MREKYLIGFPFPHVILDILESVYLILRIFRKEKENKGRVAYHAQTVHVISLRFAIVLRSRWKYFVEETSGGNFRELGVS